MQQQGESIPSMAQDGDRPHTVQGTDVPKSWLVLV